MRRAEFVNDGKRKTALNLCAAGRMYKTVRTPVFLVWD